VPRTASQRSSTATPSRSLVPRTSSQRSSTATPSRSLVPRTYRTAGDGLGNIPVHDTAAPSRIADSSCRAQLSQGSPRHSRLHGNPPCGFRHLHVLGIVALGWRAVNPHSACDYAPPGLCRVEGCFGYKSQTLAFRVAATATSLHFLFGCSATTSSRLGRSQCAKDVMCRPLQPYLRSNGR
jgi:hypothetical protein